MNEVRCPACGAENPAENRFCGSCGTALSAPASERRKLVTSVFCDLAGSTALAEQVDAEKVFALMRSYFDAARAAFERHGGAVEKFIGDAVVGMFGVPEAHEDDALRACRAALEIQRQVAALGISVRIGVNTGEVVAGDAARREMFSTADVVVLGDAVNVAARLEQAAAPREVLVGEATYRLVRDAVVVEPIAPIAARGRLEAVAAYRLLEVSPHGPVGRGTDGPLVGRSEELTALGRELEAAAGGCRLATVTGEAGVGKSRLTAELAARIGDRARVVRGACLSYGEGITFWPVAQIVRDLAGISDDDSAEEARRRLPRAIAQLLGLAEGTITADESTEAIAAFLASAASDRPLLVVIDDIQWAEPALLSLLERLPAAIGRASVLLLCLARPELREHRPDWPVTISLDPLGAADIDTLLERLEAAEETRSRLARAAAGNPLYAEELVAWMREGGDVDDLPTSLIALLGARLDRLAAAARNALERGAVEGELFHQSAVIELTDEPARAAVDGGLDELTNNGCRSRRRCGRKLRNRRQFAEDSDRKRHQTAGGRTLYLFRGDHGTTSECYGQCATYWPPLLTSGSPKASGLVKASLLGTTKRKDGKVQVTYKGHPLYTYVGDKKAGQTTGEGSNASGAKWYALAPSGATIDKD